MSSRNDRFECHWAASRALCWSYGGAQLLAIGSILTLQVPPLAGFALLTGCVAHGIWVLPRHLLLSAPGAVTGLRRTPAGWALYCRERGWRPARLCSTAWRCLRWSSCAIGWRGSGGPAPPAYPPTRWTLIPTAVYACTCAGAASASSGPSRPSRRKLPRRLRPRGWRGFASFAGF